LISPSKFFLQRKSPNFSGLLRRFAYFGIAQYIASGWAYFDSLRSLSTGFSPSKFFLQRKSPNFSGLLRRFAPQAGLEPATL
jgi:hypothetical protein